MLQAGVPLPPALLLLLLLPLLLTVVRPTVAQQPVHQPLVRVRYSGNEPVEVYPTVSAARDALRQRLRCVCSCFANIFTGLRG